MDLERAGVDGVVDRIRERVGDAPLYILALMLLGR